MTSVQGDCSASRYASEELRADKVIFGGQQNGDALRYASEELRAGREIPLTARQVDGRALR